VFRPFIIALTLLLPLVAAAQQQGASLSKCLADNTSGKDRKELARWVFLSMAAHPEIKQYSAPTAASVAGEADRAVAAMFTRLLAEACLEETRAAIKQGGAAGIQFAFQSLGQLAMQELMTDGAVIESMGRFEKFLDQQKLSKAFAPQ
jgi:hypothetical protein